MIGSIKDLVRICGQRDVCEVLKFPWTRLDCYVAMSKKHAGPPADQDRNNQGDN
jgi:hypothetical protein